MALEKGMPVMVAHLVSLVMVGYPMHYLCSAIGMVTKRGAVKCWNSTPAATGIGLASVLIAAMTAFTYSAIGAYSIAFFIHSFYKFLPWLDCTLDTAQVNCVSRYVVKGNLTDFPSESFFYYHIVNLAKDGIGNGTGGIVWGMVVYQVVTWLTVCLVISRGIHVYAKIVLPGVVIGCFVIVLFGIGVIKLDGYKHIFRYKMHWHYLMEVQVWRIVIEQVLIEMAIAQGSLIVLGSYNDSKLELGLLSALCAGVSWIVSFISWTIISTIMLTLKLEHQIDSEHIISKGPGTILVLWADIAIRMPGSHWWSGLIFLSLYWVSINSISILMLTILSTFWDIFPNLKKHGFLIDIALCSFFCLVGIFTLGTQGGIFIVALLNSWPVSMPRTVVAVCITLTITYVYGQKLFCQELQVVIGQWPNIFLRACWAVIPFILTTLFIVCWFWYSVPVVYDVPFNKVAASLGWCLVMLVLLPIFIWAIVYLTLKLHTLCARLRPNRNDITN